MPVDAEIGQPGVLRLEVRIAVARIIQLVEGRRAEGAAAEGRDVEALVNLEAQVQGRGDAVERLGALVEGAAVLHRQVGAEAAEPEGGAQRGDRRGAGGVVARGLERAVLDVGSQRKRPEVGQTEGVGAVELEVGEVVVAVAPGALVEDVVIGSLGAQVEGIELGESLAQGTLHHEVLVGLTVVGRPAQGAGRAAVGGVEVGLELPLAAVEGAEDVVAGAELLEVVAGAARAGVAVREVALGQDPGGIGADGHALGSLDVKAHGGHPGAEGTGLQAHVAAERAVAEHRLGRAEGKAVLGVVHHDAAEGLEGQHAEVVLAALEIADADAVQIDIGVGGAQAAEIRALQAGESAVVADAESGNAKKRISGRPVGTQCDRVRPGHDDALVGHDGHGREGVRRFCHQQSRRNQKGR